MLHRLRIRNVLRVDPINELRDYRHELRFAAMRDYFVLIAAPVGWPRRRRWSLELVGRPPAGLAQRSMLLVRRRQESMLPAAIYRCPFAATTAWTTSQTGLPL